MEDNTDFEQQLALEAEERARAQNEKQGADPHTYVDPNDGTVYEWNHKKQAWFPKISDDFLASYQASYGNFDGSGTTAPPTEEESAKEPENLKQALKPGEKRKPQEPAWFDIDDMHNTKVYVTGLPLDTTDEDFAELMGKCGLVMKDPANNKMKLKLYRNADGTLKGDGLCCYIRIESVELALKILDGCRIKNCEIHVERAKFQMKGEYDPTKKPRKKKAKEKEKLKKKMEKLFDWRPDKLRGERSRNEKTVIIKNMFDRTEFEKDPRAILEYQQDIREECSKCGEVKKVVVYDRHLEGVASVAFKEAEEADACITLMNGRWFAGRRLTAETWDGKTRYKIEETEAELEERISKWDKFLDNEDGDGNKVKTGNQPSPMERPSMTQDTQDSIKSSAPDIVTPITRETENGGGVTNKRKRPEGREDRGDCTTDDEGNSD